MTIGIRAHDIGILPPEELALKIAEKGFKSIQLAPGKVFKEFNINYGSITPGMANFIKESLQKQGIRIAVLGCYLNMIHPDKTERKKIKNRFKEHIRFARDFGCNIVGTETGSINADYSYSQENNSPKAFSILIDTLEELVEEAEKFGVFVCIEGVTTHVVSSPQKMKKIIDTIKSNNLQVIYDPNNLISIDNHKHHEKITEEAFDLFGDRIMIIHAKDYKVADNKIVTVDTGKGLFNYEHLLKIIKQNKPYIDILLENSTPLTVKDNVKFLTDIYNRI